MATIKRRLLEIKAEYLTAEVMKDMVFHFGEEKFTSRELIEFKKVLNLSFLINLEAIEQENRK